MTRINRPARTEGPRAAPNPLYGQSRIDKWKIRIVQFGFGFQNISPEKPELTELFIIFKKKKKKEDLTSVDSVHHMPRTAHAQQCQPETQSKLFPHTFPTWISAIHLKLKFKINGVDERKTEHDMTSYSGKITHSKSTVIIQRWRANLTVRIKWERSSISKTLTSLFTLQFSLQR